MLEQSLFWNHLLSCSEFGTNYWRCKRQMMQNTAFRLGEYKLIENEHGDLWWETHIGLGSSKSGKCFINGDILFIKPSDSMGSGFLKGEFLDHLDKLPKWEKTNYYCASYKIHGCKSGSRNHFLMVWTAGWKTKLFCEKMDQLKKRLRKPGANQLR